jgi:hypothetical protein
LHTHPDRGRLAREDRNSLPISFKGDKKMTQMQSKAIARATLQSHGIEATLTTVEAAAAINRKPQTLRKWACLETGPIRPIRVNRRLAWRVSDLQALLA